MSDLSYVRAFPETCCEEVKRGGRLDACEKVAVAAHADPDGGKPYAVCAYHARGEMVPLVELVARD